MTDPEGFDDYLGLAVRSFAGVDAVTFHGASGSGKSTAVAFLCRHPDFAGDDVVVLDDLTGARDLPELIRPLRAGRRVLAACHFPPRWLLPLRARWRIASFALDALPEKIEHWLAAQDVPYSREAVAAFCRRFGANYTDAALVLEHSPGKSFDAALARFFRECRVERTERPG